MVKYTSALTFLILVIYLFMSGVARSEASRLKDELRTRELEIELLQQELQQRDEELVATGAHTEHVHDTMLRLRSRV